MDLQLTPSSVFYIKFADEDLNGEHPFALLLLSYLMQGSILTPAFTLCQQPVVHPRSLPICCKLQPNSL